jgi:RNA polymerase sigma-70 factor (ECF subfamily)
LDYPALSAKELITACVDRRDGAAWEEFVRRFHPLIASVVLRVCRQWGEASRETTDDIIQDVYVKLCDDRIAVLRNFKSKDPDSIYGFVKVFAANHSHDQFKAARAQKRGGSTRIDSIENAERTNTSAASESTSVRVEQRMMVQQVTRCLERATSGPNAVRDRRVFWLYYRLGLSASGIANLPSIALTTKGVESTILRLTRAIREQLGTTKSPELRQNPAAKGSVTPNRSS